MLGGPVATMLRPPPITFYSGQLVKAVQNWMQEHYCGPGVSLHASFKENKLTARAAAPGLSGKEIPSDHLAGVLTRSQ